MRSVDAATCMSDERTGMATALLSEIAERLDDFAQKDGQPFAIDLRGLPMTDADRAELEAALGRGEVSATIEVAGTSEVWETAYSGVWWVRHRGADDRITSEEIVITNVPAILFSHKDDVRAAAERLRGMLSDELSSGAPATEIAEDAMQENSHVE